MRFCKHCGKEKTESDFYPNNKTRCKKCVVAQATKWKKGNPGKYAKNYLNWYHRNGRIRSRVQIENAVEWTRKNRDKVRVSERLRKAVKLGKIIKPKNCGLCGKEKRLMGHHGDYKKPYNVVWVCGSCHKKLHKPRNKGLTAPR